jgi:hypothetical protein
VIYTSMFAIGTRDVPAAYQGAAGSLLTTSQYLSAAVTVALLTLVLDVSGFPAAFAVTAGFAVAGVALAAALYVRTSASGVAAGSGSISSRA